MKFISTIFALNGAITIAAVTADLATTLMTSTSSSVTLPSVRGPEYTVWPNATTSDSTVGNTLSAIHRNRSVLSTPIPAGLPVICRIPGWKNGASTQYIFEGISYLRQLKDDPKGGPALCKGEPGPEGYARCKRVSCSHNSGIFVCDDLDREVAPTCKEVADAADDIVLYCDNDSNMQHATQGQKFGPSGSGWNVVVAGDLC